MIASLDGHTLFVSPMQIGLTSRQVIEHRVRSSSVKESNFMLAGLQMWCFNNLAERCHQRLLQFFLKQEVRVSSYGSNAG